jgi:hypothetical protein
MYEKHSTEVDGVPVSITLTSGDHAHCEIERETPLIVNRVAIRGSVHGYRWADGSWRLCPEYAAGAYELRSEYGGAYFTRAEMFGADASASQVEKGSAIVLEALRKWADEHPEALAESDRAWREREATARDEEISELEERIKLLKREKRAILNGGRIEVRVNHYTSGFSDKTRHVITKGGTVLPTSDKRR